MKFVSQRAKSRVLLAILQMIMYELEVCSDGTSEAQPRLFRENRPNASTLSDIIHVQHTSMRNSLVKVIVPATKFFSYNATKDWTLYVDLQSTSRYRTFSMGHIHLA